MTEGKWSLVWLEWRKRGKKMGVGGVHSGRPFFAIAFWEGKGKDNGMEKTITKSPFNF